VCVIINISVCCGEHCMLCTLWPMYCCDQFLWCINVWCVSMLRSLWPILVVTDVCCGWHVAYECGACAVQCCIAINVLLGMDVYHVWMLSLLRPILVATDTYCVRYLWCVDVVLVVAMFVVTNDNTHYPSCTLHHILVVLIPPKSCIYMCACIC